MNLTKKKKYEFDEINVKKNLKEMPRPVGTTTIENWSTES
jgi:hypothetical protein